MSNGLNDLNNRRKRRQPPPPKHPRSEQQDQPSDTEPQAETSADSVPESGPQTHQSTPKADTPERERSDATRAKRTPSVEAYLDQELLNWLWQVEAAAVERRARSVVSPTIRLALQELKKRMSAEQVVEELLSRPPKGAGHPGRPRR